MHGGSQWPNYGIGIFLRCTKCLCFDRIKIYGGADRWARSGPSICCWRIEIRHLLYAQHGHLLITAKMWHSIKWNYLNQSQKPNNTIDCAFDEMQRFFFFFFWIMCNNRRILLSIHYCFAVVQTFKTFFFNFSSFKLKETKVWRTKQMADKENWKSNTKKKKIKQIKQTKKCAFFARYSSR